MRAFLSAALSLCCTQTGAESWPDRKCAIFAQASEASAPDHGPQAPSPTFRAKIESFIAARCEAPRDACPQSAQDLALADVLALIVAVEGMSTTFLPISCPEP